MSIDEREDVARLLPPAAAEAHLPAAPIRRQQLLREMTGPTRRRWHIPGPALAAGALTATVAVAALGGVVLNRDDEPRPVEPGTSTGAPITSLAGLLRQVDAAARTQPVVEARDNQFVYVRSTGPGGPGYREVWSSVDGTRTGLLSTSQGGGTTPMQPEQLPAGTPALDAAIDYPTFRRLRTLNTDPATLLARIKKVRAGHGDDPDAEAFDALRQMLAAQIVPPRVRATIYRAAALVPGAYFVRDATDGIGRHGPAIAHKHEGDTLALIIDPKTGALLGDRSVAYVQSAVVDRLRQRPAGTTGAKVPTVEPPPAPVPLRGVDWANTAVGLPSDRRFSRVPKRQGVPVVTFAHGSASVGGVRYSVDPRSIQYGELDGAGGPDGPAEEAVLTIKIGTAGSATSSYAVVAYFGDSVDTAPAQLVAWVDTSTAAPRVTVKDKVVTVGSQRYRWNGAKFVAA